MDLSIVEMCVALIFFFKLFVLLVWFLLNVQIADNLLSISQRCYATVNASTLLPNNHIPSQPHFCLLDFVIRLLLHSSSFFLYFVSGWDSFSGGFYLKSKKMNAFFFPLRWHCFDQIEFKVRLYGKKIEFTLLIDETTTKKKNTFCLSSWRKKTVEYSIWLPLFVT